MLSLDDQTDKTEDGEVCGLLQMISCEIPYWHYLNVDKAEITCLKAIILAKSVMHSQVG